MVLVVVVLVGAGSGSSICGGEGGSSCVVVMVVVVCKHRCGKRWFIWKKPSRMPNFSVCFVKYRIHGVSCLHLLLKPSVNVKITTNQLDSLQAKMVTLCMIK